MGRSVRLAMTTLLALSAACSSGDAAGPATTAPATNTTPTTPHRTEVILFARAEGFVHSSIAGAVAALTPRLRGLGLTVQTTDDPAVFTDGRLSTVGAVVFLSTTGDVLEPPHQAALELWVRAGGGWAGVHAAADAEYDWPFYGELVGSWFQAHPEVQPARVIVEDRAHPSTAHLPAVWQRSDEWYDFRTNPRGRVRVLARLDPGSYGGSAAGPDRPVTWCAAIGMGTSWYTAMGHTDESWTDPAFLDHVVGGITSVLAGGGDCAPS